MTLGPKTWPEPQYYVCTCTQSDEATHLNEWEQEADGKVGQPVYDAGDHEGGRSVGLFKQLAGQDEWDATWQRGEKIISHNKLLTAHNKNNHLRYELKVSGASKLWKTMEFVGNIILSLLLVMYLFYKEICNSNWQSIVKSPKCASFHYYEILIVVAKYPKCDILTHYNQSLNIVFLKVKNSSGLSHSTMCNQWFQTSERKFDICVDFF